MLTEHFIGAISTPTSAQKQPTANVVGAKDASIFTFRLSPAPVQCTGMLKKSISGPHAVAVSESHVFAAQSGKAVIHVYGREKMNQEATVAFPERISCIALASKGSVLAIGTETGSVIVWEIYTGRVVTIPECHIQAITCIATDPSGGFLITASNDSNVQVWNLSHLRQFSSLAISSVSADRQALTHTLASHKKKVIAVAVGCSATSSSSIVVSISDDQTAIVWDLQKGISLRTYLLPTVPVAVVMDRLDRGFYVSYTDGTIQQFSFFDPATLATDPTKIAPPESVSAPAEPDAVESKSERIQTSQLLSSPEQKWLLPDDTIGNAVSLALSWDSTHLISGHASGVVGLWDVATGSFTTLTTLPGPVTSVLDLAPSELLESSLTKQTGATCPQARSFNTAIVKPRLDLGPDTATKNAARNGSIPLNYTIHTKLNQPLPSTSGRSREGRAAGWETYHAYSSGGLFRGTDITHSQQFLDDSLAELANWSGESQTSSNPSPSTADSTPTAKKAKVDMSGDVDFVAFGKSEDLSPEAENKILRQRLARLEEREGVHLLRIEQLDRKYSDAVMAWHAASMR